MARGVPSGASSRRIPANRLPALVNRLPFRFNRGRDAAAGRAKGNGWNGIPEGIDFPPPGKVAPARPGRPLHPRGSLPFLSVAPEAVPQPGGDVQHRCRLQRLHVDVERPEIHRQPLLRLPRHRLPVRRRHRLPPRGNVQRPFLPQQAYRVHRALVFRPVPPELRAAFRSVFRYPQDPSGTRARRIRGCHHRAGGPRMDRRSPRLLLARQGGDERQKRKRSSRRGDPGSLDRRSVAGPQAFRPGRVPAAGPLHPLFDRGPAVGQPLYGLPGIQQHRRPLPDGRLFLPPL